MTIQSIKKLRHSYLRLVKLTKLSCLLYKLIFILSLLPNCSLCVQCGIKVLKNVSVTMKKNYSKLHFKFQHCIKYINYSGYKKSYSFL